MAWLTRVGRWLAPAVDLLAPPRCAFCRADAPGDHGTGAVVCAACSRALASDVPRCPACGEPAVGAAACPRCQGRCRDWDGLAVLGPYADEVRDAVLRAKRPAGAVQAAALATLLVRKHRPTLEAWRIDVVVPVPLHWLRRLARGTSAAEELARGVAAGLGLPCRALLRRRRATPMQNELPFAARRGNVRDAFGAAPNAAGRRVLLVDDVTTSGATLASCRRALVERGAAAVYAAVVARADRGAPAA